MCVCVPHNFLNVPKHIHISSVLLGAWLLTSSCYKGTWLLTSRMSCYTGAWLLTSCPATRGPGYSPQGCPATWGPGYSPHVLLQGGLATHLMSCYTGAWLLTSWMSWLQTAPQPHQRPRWHPGVSPPGRRRLCSLCSPPPTCSAAPRAHRMAGSGDPT